MSASEEASQTLMEHCGHRGRPEGPPALGVAGLVPVEGQGLSTCSAEEVSAMA